MPLAFNVTKEQRQIHLLHQHVCGDRWAPLWTFRPHFVLVQSCSPARLLWRREKRAFSSVRHYKEHDKTSFQCLPIYGCGDVRKSVGSSVTLSATLLSLPCKYPTLSTYMLLYILPYPIRSDLEQCDCWLIDVGRHCRYAMKAIIKRGRDYAAPAQPRPEPAYVVPLV